MKTPLVVYHRADYDGIFCREIAKHFLGDSAESVGWDYGDSDAIVPPGIERIYMLDISIEAWMGDSRLIWIDHHKTAFEKWDSSIGSPEGDVAVRIPGYRIDGVAACRLVWQWFTFNPYEQMEIGQGIVPQPLPSKQDFIDRKVSEPWAVRLAGEYDIWDKRDPNAELFQHGLRSRELTEGDWRLMLSLETKASLISIGHRDILNPDGTSKNPIVAGLLSNGTVLQYAKREENESIIKAAGFTIQFEGLTFLACNHARYNSFLFVAGLKPEHDGCLGFAWRDGQWTVSLYHAPGKEHHDLSAIAKKFGGGGHKGACGFRTKTLPFLP